MVTKAKVIAVTGASRGIGAAIAVELAHRGFTVACLTRKGKGPETQAAKAIAGQFVDVACDVTDEASLKAAFAEVVKKAGALNGLVNNAGIHLDGASHELPTATYEKVMLTNATAVFAACREAYPHLVQSGGRRDYALPRSGMGEPRYPRHRRRARLHRDRSESGRHDAGSACGLPEKAHSIGEHRLDRRRGKAGRGDIQRRHSVSVG